jgi:hypothetical protein
VGAGTAYVVSKVSTATLKEISNWIGPIGWGVSATLAGSLSALFGVAWALYCDHICLQKEAQSKPILLSSEGWKGDQLAK